MPPGMTTHREVFNYWTKNGANYDSVKKVAVLADDFQRFANYEDLAADKFQVPAKEKNIPVDELQTFADDWYILAGGSQAPSCQSHVFSGKFHTLSDEWYTLSDDSHTLSDDSYTLSDDLQTLSDDSQVSSNESHHPMIDPNVSSSKSTSI